MKANQKSILVMFGECLTKIGGFYSIFVVNMDRCRSTFTSIIILSVMELSCCAQSLCKWLLSLHWSSAGQPHSDTTSGGGDRQCHISICLCVCVCVCSPTAPCVADRWHVGWDRRMFQQEVGQSGSGWMEINRSPSRLTAKVCLL